MCAQFGLLRQILTVVLIVAIIQGCFFRTNTDANKIDQFLEAARALSVKIKPGDVGKIPLNNLSIGDVLIVVNGGYSGSFLESSLVSEDIIREIRDDYIEHARWATILVLVNNQKIVAYRKVSMDNLITNPQPVGNNARVGVLGQEALVKCYLRSSVRANQLSGDVWNTDCYLVLEKFY